MTYSRERIDAHLNGDCDAATCPLCETEIENADIWDDAFTKSQAAIEREFGADPFTGYGEAEDIDTVTAKANSNAVEAARGKRIALGFAPDNTDQETPQ